MHRGFLPIWRKIEDNPLWKEKRKFSRFECWFDILKEARYIKESNKVMIKGRVIECGYGQVIYSLETWGRRWRRTKSEVKRVLDLFTELSMVRYENVTVCIRLTVLNYSQYNDMENGFRTVLERFENGLRTTLEPTEQSNNNKQRKKQTKEDLVFPEWLPEDQWVSFLEHRRLLKSPMTIHAQKLAISKLEDFKKKGQDPVKVIQQSIERGWKGLFDLPSKGYWDDA